MNDSPDQAQPLLSLPEPTPKYWSRRRLCAQACIALGAFDLVSCGTVQEQTNATLPHPGTTLLTYKGYTDYIACVEWSPDGKRIATVSYDKTVQVWDASNGSLLFEYPGHSDLVWGLAWSPDGKRIATGSLDNIVKV